MSPTRTLSTAESRRADVLEAAIAAFARSGYFGANTTEIAHAAGISQAYLYRLFENKEALFVAVIAEVRSRVGRGLDEARSRHPEVPIARLLHRLAASGDDGDSGDNGMVLLHAAAAAHVPVIGTAVRECYRSQADRLRAHGATDADIRAYFAWGQYANTLRSAGMPRDASDEFLTPSTD